VEYCQPYFDTWGFFHKVKIWDNACHIITLRPCNLINVSTTVMTDENSEIYNILMMLIVSSSPLFFSFLGKTLIDIGGFIYWTQSYVKIDSPPWFFFNSHYICRQSKQYVSLNFFLLKYLF
jgi:hypothetical protein